MKKLFIYLSCLLCPIVNANEQPNIIIFGDSLSAGYGIEIDQAWPSLMQEKLRLHKYSHHVVNASISGETTEGGVARIDNILEKYTPDLIIIELGGNDGLRGFPTKLIKSNLNKIIKTSIVKNSSVLLLGIKIPLNYGPRYTADFEKIYHELADENDIKLIEFFMKNVALNNNLMQDDGIHPNKAAQPILLENIWVAITNII
jgi:acyl-CoA thioesterase-1